MSASAAPPFLGAGTNVPEAEARAAIVPMPLECSVTYGRGTARGPEAILTASAQVELYDEQFGFEPHRCGICTDRFVDCSEGGPRAARQRLRDRIGVHLDAGRWPVTLGGEHSLTPAAVEAAANRHERLVVLQLDAHADLRERYENDPDSHACAMARCLEFAEVRALGIRNYSVDEARRIADGIAGYRIVHAWETGGEAWRSTLLDGLAGRPVYLTVDLDYFDPSVISMTGTPEPGGGAWWPTIAFLRRLFETADVVAADVVELAPKDGLHASDFTAARLVHKLLAMRFPDAGGTRKSTSRGES